MSNTAETPTIIQPDVSANRVTNLRKRLFTWFAEQRLHCIVFIAYVTVTVTVSCFHEPWFDEAQAWLIARDCSWKELLTVRTHYEGHPPLWWMLLAIPAKLGMPYEIGLKSLNLMCAALMIWLLEFKTKLPELLKVILPFSYFLCYQYGVTSRPYALMIAAMLLIAINWNNRNTKPWSHTQHDAAMRHELLRIGNRRHACLELDDSISLRRTLAYKKQAAFRGTCSATGIRHHTAPQRTPRTRHIPR